MGAVSLSHTVGVIHSCVMAVNDNFMVAKFVLDPISNQTIERFKMIGDNPHINIYFMN